MADYVIGQALSDVARAIGKIAEAVAEKNRMELARQKREWIRDGGTRETF